MVPEVGSVVTCKVSLLTAACLAHLCHVLEVFPS